MDERQIPFDIYELNMIFKDQGGALENIHIGDICDAVQECPLNHVVEEDGVQALDVTDDVHHFGLVGLWTALVDDGQTCAAALGVGPSRRRGVPHAFAEQCR